ncbi:DNA (cytosine-5-)-methyltransferase [Enterococcus cecorum]|uniref:DNA (cytosine-5-)-methyltransferase n=1 Tax=Enterococcus cecorum TaxID=44008 RepID=UPI00341AEC8A
MSSYYKTLNLGDISKLKVEDIPDHDLFTCSFPCQSISISGLQRGFEEGSGTRSSLLWECKRVIEGKKPKYILMENVKNLVSKKFKPTFDKWCEWLEGQGYTNYWQVLNAKDYGVPQNRERVFMISILGVHEPYVFPEKQELHIRLKDVLEKEVDSKFYVKEEKIAQFLKNVDGKIDLSKKRLGTLHKNNDMQHSTRSIVFNDNFESLCLTATMCKDAPKVMVSERLFGLFDKEDKKNQAGGVYNKDKLSPTLSTMQGGWQQPLIIDDESMITIRKLTPKECWRLMGFDDSDFEKAEQVNSNTQLYKQAGNSIVVNCLEGIFYELFKNTEYMEVESENVA